MKIVHVKKNYNNRTVNVILEVDRQTKEEVDRMKIGWNVCRVVDYVQIIRCFNCCQYGHTAANCKNTLTCGYCGGVHKSPDCESDYASCVNCVKANNKYNLQLNEEHDVWDKECEYYKRIEEKVASRRR